MEGYRQEGLGWDLRGQKFSGKIERGRMEDDITGDTHMVKG